MIIDIALAFIVGRFFFQTAPKEPRSKVLWATVGTFMYCAVSLVLQLIFGGWVVGTPPKYIGMMFLFAIAVPRAIGLGVSYLTWVYMENAFGEEDELESEATAAEKEAASDSETGDSEFTISRTGDESLEKMDGQSRVDEVELDEQSRRRQLKPEELSGEGELDENLSNTAITNDALVDAVRGRKEQTVRHLLQRGADTEVTDSNGATPLIIAASQGDNAIVRLLLLNHANADAEDDDCNTAWDLAHKNGHRDIARLLR